MSRCLLCAVFLCAWAGSVSAQGLADAARKESERRSRTKGAGKAYTTDDLRRGGTPSAEESPAATGPAEEAPPPAGESGTPEAQGEARWRTRAESLRQNVMRLEREVAEADRAATSAAYDGPMDRYGHPNTAHPLAVARAKRAREALASARKTLEDFEEEARRAGVPPGWLR